MGRFKARFVGFKNAAEGFETAAFEGGGDVADEVGVGDRRVSWGIVGKWARGC